MHKSILMICLFAFTCAHVQAAQTEAQIPIWPGTPPDAQPAPGPQTDWANITRPTLAVYSPARDNTGVAIVVFPGGGFEGLAINLQGTEICDWPMRRVVARILPLHSIRAISGSAARVWH